MFPSKGVKAAQRYGVENIPSQLDANWLTYCNVVTPTHVYFFGGRKPGVAVSPVNFRRLNLTTLNWENLDAPNGPASRYSAFCAINGNKIYVAAGGDGTDTAFSRNLKDVFSYDLQTSTWQRLADLPVAIRPPLESALVDRPHLNSIVYGGKWYIAHQLGAFSVYVYDFAANTWTTLTPPAGSPLAPYINRLAIVNNKILFTWGQFGTGRSYGYLFNPQNGTWVTLPNTPNFEIGSPYRRFASISLAAESQELVGNRLYVRWPKADANDQYLVDNQGAYITAELYLDLDTLLYSPITDVKRSGPVYVRYSQANEQVGLVSPLFNAARVNEPYAFRLYDEAGSLVHEYIPGTDFSTALDATCNQGVRCHRILQPNRQIVFRAQGNVNGTDIASRLFVFYP